MENSGRDNLKKGQIILLSQNEDGSSPQEYMIDGIIGEGSSAVCYEARCLATGKKGKLKEFYPVDIIRKGQNWYYSMKRLESGQLVPAGGTIRTFSDMCDEYIETYRLLDKMICDDTHNEILKNYIQDGNILFGSLVNDEKYLSSLPEFSLKNIRKHNATVYIWSSGIAGRPFDEYLAEIRRNAKDSSDMKISDILNIVLAAADGIRALHIAGLMHLDVKPANFLLPYNSGNGINTGSISMFDINTFYNIADNMPKIAGTKGYCAPEVMRGRADNRSDIYSIGAMLFNALVTDKNGQEYLYDSSRYDDIENLIRHSYLIESGKAGSDFNFMSRITNILKKCLAAKPSERYNCCSNLIKDLKSAEVVMKQYAIDPRQLGRGKKYAIVAAYPNGITEPTIIMQKLLHEHPLFETVDKPCGDINVLVISENSYGQKFIDVCLEAGQLKDHRLRIRSMSDDPAEDKNSYVSFRRSMKRFININDSHKGDKDHIFADLDFVSMPGKKFTDGHSIDEAKEKNSLTVKNIIREAIADGKPYHYIFIATGGDRLNQAIAILFDEELRRSGEKYRCPVCYVYSREKKDSGTDMLHPVNINKEITADSISPELERMAFNTHIVWKKTLDFDTERSLKEFREDKYNYASSMAFVLSIKYKLYSLGIIIRPKNDRITKIPEGFVIAENEEEAARLFRERISGDDEISRKNYALLAVLEHRRWIINMSAYGWTAPIDKNGNIDLDEYVKNSLVNVKVKDDYKLIHHCLFASTTKMPISSKDFTADNWDNSKIKNDLDELDTVSVELHRRYLAVAERARSSGNNVNEDIEQIRRLISGCGEAAARAFSKYMLCLKNIHNRSKSYSEQYGSYEGELIKAVEDNAPKNVQQAVRERISIIKRFYFPFIEANLYRDYKDYDMVLVKAVPFILTHTFRRNIAVAFSDSTDLLPDIASAAMLSPQRLSYIFCCYPDTDRNRFADRFKIVLAYLGGREAGCEVSLNVICSPDLTADAAEELHNILENVKNEHNSRGTRAVFDNIVLTYPEEGQSCHDCASGLLKMQKPDLFDGSSDIFEKADNERFIDSVYSFGIPCFKIDAVNGVFTSLMGCEFLRYAEKSVHLRLSDILLLMGTMDIAPDYPEFADDLEVIWDIFHESDKDAWLRLCKLLKEKENSRPPLAVFELDKISTPKTEKLMYILPEFTFKEGQKILSRLIELGVAGEDSRIIGYTGENCRAEIICSSEYTEGFETLFSDAGRLLGFYCPKISVVGNKAVFSISPMNADDICMPDDEIYGILEKLHRKEEIVRLKRKNDTISFEYTSQRIKNMLTSFEWIVSVYNYFRILNMGEYDDTGWKYSFRTDNSDERYTIDLSVSKGSKMIAFQCGPDEYPDALKSFLASNGVEICGVETL